MASGPTPANVEAIRYLRSQGYSARQIERELGIGGSGRLIKFAEESKPAGNLTPALTALAARVRGEPVETVPAVERRRTRTGQAARVRRGVITTAEGDQQIEVRSPRSVLLNRLIEDAASWGGRIKAVVTWEAVQQYGAPLTMPGVISLWEKGGWDAGMVQMLSRGTEAGWRQLCYDKPGVQYVGGRMLDLQVTIV